MEKGTAQASHSLMIGCVLFKRLVSKSDKDKAHGRLLAHIAELCYKICKNATLMLKFLIEGVLMMTLCPLCASLETAFYMKDARRSYRSCDCCALVFVESKYHLCDAQERAEYDKHENDPGDPGYRGFLSRLVRPLLPLIPANSCGLDFGCGPGPTLSLLLEAHGHKVSLFDKFYYAKEDVWKPSYDFVTASEVVEHLRTPMEELNRLWDCLKVRGILAIMTKRVRNKDAFSRWHYKNDPTHIIFLSDATVRWLARYFQAELIVESDDIFFLRKCVTTA